MTQPLARKPLNAYHHGDLRDALIKAALQEAATGRLVAVIGQTYPLERAAEAHATIEARKSIGKVLLIP